MALDVIHSLIVDDVNGLVDRDEVHEKLAENLLAPLADPESDEYRAYKRERWGLSKEARAAAERMDRFGVVPTYDEHGNLVDDEAEEWRPGMDE